MQGFCYIQGISLFGAADNTVIRAGAAAQIHAGTCNLYSDINGICKIIKILIGDPLSIQSASRYRRIQYGNLLTATGSCKPSHKGVARAGRIAGKRCWHSVIKHLRRMANAAAIAIISNIAVAFRCLSGVDTIEIHIGFHHTALDQAGQHLAACLTPKTKGTDQIISGFAVCNRVKEYAAGFLGPTGTDIVRKRCDGIILVLGQCQIVFCDIAVKGIFHT